ncbi:unnamed protein product [Merluccius merluccius]
MATGGCSVVSHNAVAAAAACTHIRASAPAGRMRRMHGGDGCGGPYSESQSQSRQGQQQQDSYAVAHAGGGVS